MLHIADFEQSSFRFPILDSFIQSFWQVLCSNDSHKSTESMKIFQFQKIQLFLNNHGQKVKLRRFTCIKTGKEGFAAKTAINC